ncbi:MAG: hypothetical protein E6J85_18550 [Deltaproteobacteria bacterium]|nr:MAG: hypothetical protein E6J85_18550 [Deltaproteobacteria bacterium]
MTSGPGALSRLFTWKNWGFSAMERRGRATRTGSVGSLAGMRRTAGQGVNVAGSYGGMSGTETSTAPSPLPPGTPSGEPSAT